EDNIISELPPYSAVTPTEPIDSLSMGGEHLNTISETESDEFIKCSKEIYSNPLFDEEIIPMEIDPHSFNAESDLIESMPNHDSSITISSKIDSLCDEFAGELTLLKSIPPGIDETDCHPEKETRYTKRLLYDNSSPHGKTGTLNIKMMGDVSDQKVSIPNLTITRISNQEKSPDLLSHMGFEAFQPSVECPMIINGKNTLVLDVPLFHFYPLDQFKYGGIKSSSVT
nr:hypothetical protein [Tanacetum cinerariifolium]